MNDTLSVKNLGPIKNCEVEFGDLTFIVGPQASGKTMFLETLYLALEKEYIEHTLLQNSYNFKNWDEFVRLYFGNHKTKIWSKNTDCTFNKENIKVPIGKNVILSNQKESAYIPAQRSITVSDGRCKNFNEYEQETPFVIKEFSEDLRRFIKDNNKIEQLKDFDNIYHKGEIYITKERMGQSKIRMKVADADIPFSSWSMGQKEFTPLQICFNSLKDRVSYIIIEEPELGLHPKAIQDFLKFTLKNCNFEIPINYDIFWSEKKKNKLIISTHSDTIIQFVWALSNIAHISDKDKYINAVMKMLNADSEDVDLQKNLKYLFNHRNNIKTYFFNDGISKDISSLDAWSDDPDIVDWGGLTTFASTVGDIVADVNAE